MGNRFQYAITASDQTAKGVKSAEKGLSALGRTADKAGRVAGKAEDARRKGILEASGAIERLKDAAGSVSTFAPGVSRYSSALGGVARAATGAASGVKGAAQAGGALAGTLGTVAAVAGGAVAVVGALAAGAFKLASGWTAGTMQLGLMSRGLGYATADLQRFQAVGEQFGVDKDSTTGALGGFGGALNDAKYGRNDQAAALLAQWGLKMKYGADGQVDNKAMLMDVADVMSKIKNPYGQARAASILGVENLLPVLREGSGAIRAKMDAAGKYAAIASDQDVTDATRVYQKGVLTKQLAGRAGMVADRGAALGGEGALDAALSGGQALADGRGPSVGRIASGAVTMLSTASHAAAGAVARLGGVLGRELDYIEQRLRAAGFGAAAARGVVAGVHAEGGTSTAVNPTSGALGIGQWLGPRKRELRRRYGEHASLEHQTDHLIDELNGGDFGGKFVRHDASAEDANHAYITKFMRPGPGTAGDLRRSSAFLKAHPADRIDLHVHGLPAGARVTAKRGSTPVAVGQAMLPVGP